MINKKTLFSTILSLIVFGVVMWWQLDSKDATAVEGNEVDAALIEQSPQNEDDTTLSTSNQDTQVHQDSEENLDEPASRLLELPKIQRGEQIIYHKAYTLSYNKAHNTPNWVAWQLTKAETRGYGERCVDFFVDPEVDERHQVSTEDYSGSGYDRGHMCPAGDNKWDAKAMTECFYLSNMCPQDHELNSNWWEALESACRRWARQEGSVYIVTGPVYAKSSDNSYEKDGSQSSKQSNVSGFRRKSTIGRKHKVSVPTGFFKCVLSLRKGHEKAIAFYYDNNASYQPMESACLTVDSVESLTGYNFFVNVSDKLEKRVESQCRLSDWR